MTELYHFGIKGQRWGVRRFQSPDGTLTAAGKARYKSYKKDFKAYNKLNRHVAASQKHLKEEGVLLDRAKDRYETFNRAYRKTMAKSSGLFGLKAGEKARKVANAQLYMDQAGKDYNTAASAYGVAKKILKEDSKALKDHVNNMVRNYGKGSINELRTKNVKMGQNKLQKLLQGAPKSVIFSNKRDTEEFIKTGTTLANLPVIGNLYTAKYIADRELGYQKDQIDRTTNTSNYRTGQLKKNKDKSKQAGYDVYDAPDYLKKTKYAKETKAELKAEREQREKQRVKAAKLAAKMDIEDAKEKAAADIREAKTHDKANRDKQVAEVIAERDKKIADINAKRDKKIHDITAKQLAKEIDRASRKPRSNPSTANNEPEEILYYNPADYKDTSTSPKSTRSYKKKKKGLRHSAYSYGVIRSNEIYHHDR